MSMGYKDVGHFGPFDSVGPTCRSWKFFCWPPLLRRKIESRNGPASWRLRKILGHEGFVKMSPRLLPE